MGQIDTGTEDLLARVDDGVGVLTMNRPERRNALSGPMLAALGRTLAAFEVDDEVGCVLITGAGGAFCAGGDVKAMAGGPDDNTGRRVSLDERIHLQRLDQRAVSGRLFEMPKPTVAALPGAAAGAGLSIALACDLRYAAERAVLTTAFARVGFAGDYGGTWFLTRLVGPSRARELYYLSTRISAEEAKAEGIVNGVFPDDRLEEEAFTIAKRLAAGPRVAYRYMKENLNRAVFGELGECLDMEAAHHIRTGLTEDHREAVAAFNEKNANRPSRAAEVAGVRLRQVALVAKELDPVVAELREVLAVEQEPFSDPGIKVFGLHNAVMEVGDTFVEVVSPVEDGTTAGRYLERRGGDGGYMAIFQMEDLESSRSRIDDLGIRVVWRSDQDDIAGTHLHPKDLPGALVSIDWARPPESWRWAGPRWTGRAPDYGSGGVVGVTVQSADPEALAARWGAVLDRAPVISDGGASVPLDGGEVHFVPLSDDRGEGICGFEVTRPGAPPGQWSVGGVRVVVRPSGS